MDMILGGGIVVIFMVVVSLAFYVINIISSVIIYRAAAEMSESPNPQVRAGGDGIKGIGIASIVLACIPGLGLIAMILNFVNAPKTNPDLYPTQSENVLSPEEIAELSPVERIRAKREGLIGSDEPADVHDVRGNTFLKLSLIFFIAGVALTIISIFTLGSGIAEYIQNNSSNMEILSGEYTEGGSFADDISGEWIIEDGSTIQEEFPGL